MKKQELNDIYQGIISLLKDAPRTIVMNNQGSARGQIYTVHTATHEQASRGIADRILFCGTARETANYLQGYRDLLKEIAPIDYKAVGDARELLQDSNLQYFVSHSMGEQAKLHSILNRMRS